MADRSSERDRRVRELMSNKNPGFDVLGQAQAEIQDAQSELYNHVAMQQVQDQSRLQETSTIAEAAQGMMAMENGGNQLQAQVAAMNPSTQATMSKFGVKPSQSQNSQRNNQSQKSVTKTGDTTNIKTENITNNKTEIKITQPSIPMQTPQIPMRAVAAQKSGEDSSSKFKAWLSGMFARQQNEAEIQKKEYRKKEWALGRTTSKLMNKIKEATSNLGTKLDPQNMTMSLGGQIKWLLLIFGATIIAKVWKPAMKVIANIEAGFRSVFGLPINEDLRNNSSGTLSIMEQIKSAIGIKRGENTSLIEGIGKVFMQGINKLIDKLEFWFNDRATALKEITFPEINVGDLSGIASVFQPFLDGAVGAIKGIGQYLGDIITVALGGSKGKVKVAANRVKRQAQKVFTDTTGKQVSAGDSALATGNGRNYMRSSDYDAMGNLKANASSTQAMSESLISMFNDKSKSHTTEIATGVEQLFSTAKRSGSVVIDPALLQYLGMTSQDINTLRRQGMLSQKQYKIIAVKPTESQKDEMGRYQGHAGFWTGGIAGTLAGAGAGFAAGTAIPGVGNVTGLVLGGVLGAAGAGLGGYVGSAAGAGVDEILKQWTSKGLYPKLVPVESRERSADGSRGIGKTLWVLNKQGADAVIGKFTSGMHNKDMDLTNKEFYDRIQKLSDAAARRNGVYGNRKENLNGNELRAAQANYSTYQSEYYDKFESKDPNSWNQTHYGNFNAAMDTVGGFVNSATSAIGRGMYNLSSTVKGFKVSKGEQTRRANYFMKKLMETGLTKEQAAGIVGNAAVESGNFTVINEKRYDVNGPSGGIVQWHDTDDGRVHNLKDLENYYGRELKRISFEEQVDYLIKQIQSQGAMSKNLSRDLGMRGFKGSVWQAVRNASSAAESATIFERAFESSGDFKKDGNRNRMQYANTYLKTYIDTGGSLEGGTGSSNLNFDIKELSSDSGNQNMALGWLGDSQTAAFNGIFPRLVGNGLGLTGNSFFYYGRASVNANHYLGSTKEPVRQGRSSSTNCESCTQALSYILNSRPKYTILELGHNGMAGYSRLVQKIQGAGIGVVGIKMWEIDGSRNGMATISADKMSQQYEGINPSVGWIDLTHVDIPKRDGVHATQEGYKIAAAEVLRQIHGATPKGNGEGGGLLDGLGDKVIDGFSDLLKTGAELLDPKLKGEPDASKLLLTPKTKEQKDIERKINNYETASETASQLSYELKGAKVSDKGIYFDVNGYRAYVDPSRSNAFFGFNKNDISYITKIDPNTGKETGELSDDELKTVSQATTLFADSFLTKYEGKGTVTDIMTGRDGKPIFFDINKNGYKADSTQFSKLAKDSINNISKGIIRFKICPSKDRKRFSIINIYRGYPVMITGNWRDEYRAFREGRSTPPQTLGPDIFARGRKWKDYLSNISSDWQPVARLLNVNLESAGAANDWTKILAVLSLGAISKGKDGKFYDEKGELIDNKDVEILKRIGAIDYQFGGTGRVNSDYNFSVKNSFVDDKFDGLKSGYFIQFGKDKKERLEYYNKHKDDGTFAVKDGKIIGPNGLVWGTQDDKGKVSLYNNTDFDINNGKLGAEGARENEDVLRESLNSVKAAAYGLVNQTQLLKLGDVSRNAARTNKLTNNQKKQIVDQEVPFHEELYLGQYGKAKLTYNVRYGYDGSIKGYTITTQQAKNFLKQIGKDDPMYVNGLSKDPKTNKEVIYKDRYELVRAIYYQLARQQVREMNAKKGIELNSTKRDKNGQTELDRETDKFMNNRANKYYSRQGKYGKASQLNLLVKDLLNNKKIVQDIRFNFKLPFLEYAPDKDKYSEKQDIFFVDGAKMSKNYYITKTDVGDEKKFIETINEKISKFINDAESVVAIENYDKYLGDSMKKLQSSFLKEYKSKEGLQNYEIGPDGVIKRKDTGVIIGTKGKKGFNFNLTNQQKKENYENYQGNIFEQNKVQYYEKAFGAEYDGQDLWLYNNDKTKRIKIDLNKKHATSSEDLQSVLVNNSTQALDTNGKWLGLNNGNDIYKNDKDTINADTQSILKDTKSRAKTNMESILSEILKENEKGNMDSIKISLEQSKKDTKKITSLLSQEAILKEIANHIDGLDTSALDSKLERILDEQQGQSTARDLQRYGLQGGKYKNNILSDKNAKFVSTSKGAFIISKGKMYPVTSDLKVDEVWSTSAKIENGKLVSSKNDSDGNPVFSYDINQTLNNVSNFGGSTPSSETSGS